MIHTTQSVWDHPTPNTRSIRAQSVIKLIHAHETRPINNAMPEHSPWPKDITQDLYPIPCSHSATQSNMSEWNPLCQINARLDHCLHPFHAAVAQNHQIHLVIPIPLQTAAAKISQCPKTATIPASIPCRHPLPTSDSCQSLKFQRPAKQPSRQANEVSTQIKNDEEERAKESINRG